MISRIWHGYTSFDQADAYESLLKEEELLSKMFFTEWDDYRNRVKIPWL